jgi:hypothetical protein
MVEGHRITQKTALLPKEASTAFAKFTHGLPAQNAAGRLKSRDALPDPVLSVGDFPRRASTISVTILPDRY